MQLEPNPNPADGEYVLSFESPADCKAVIEAMARSAVARAARLDEVDGMSKFFLGVGLNVDMKINVHRLTTDFLVERLIDFGSPATRLTIAQAAKTSASQVEAARVIILSEHAAMEASKLSAQLQGDNTPAVPELLPEGLDYDQFLSIIDDQDPR